MIITIVGDTHLNKYIGKTQSYYLIKNIGSFITRRKQNDYHERMGVVFDRN